jgi:hypothetical protein
LLIVNFVISTFSSGTLATIAIIFDIVALSFTDVVDVNVTFALSKIGIAICDLGGTSDPIVSTFDGGGGGG